MAERLRVATTTDKPNEREEKVRALLTTARERFHSVIAAESQLRRDMQDDLNFRVSDQWDPQAKAARASDDRPCLTINRLPQFIRQVTNAQRAANMSARVTGVDDHADVTTAEVVQGLIRFIERDSDASIAYSTAGEHQATIGRGYWRIITEYESPRSFVQTIKIKRVRNPFTVFQDPASQEADGSDSRFYIITEDLPETEFVERFGKEALRAATEFESIEGHTQTVNDWMPEGKVRVAEYWWVETERTSLLLVEFTRASGVKEQVAMLEAEFEQIPPEIRESQNPVIVNRRPTEVRVVKQALITGSSILEGNDDKTDGRIWPGQWIPIVPVLGDEIDINGRVDLRGMIRDAKDPQRLYNIQQSTLAETLQLVPRSPWVGYEGQFEGHEPEWRMANRKAFAYLQVKPVSLDNQTPLPLPQRVSSSADISAIMVAIQQSDQDLKATMGLYEPSLGIRQSSGQSGKAIEALKKQGEQANSNFIDNMSRAIRFSGRIIVDLIPKIYDAKRVLRILGTDEIEKTVIVHSADETAPQPDAMPEGIDGVYDLSMGRYDVVVSAGPSLETKRAEAFEALNGFIQAYPAAFPLLGDLLVGNLDWPGAKAAAERLKKAVPPGVIDDEDDQGVPPHIAAQMQQLMAQLEATGIELSEAKRIIESKQIETSAKAASEREKAATSLAVAQMKADSELALQQMKMQHEAMMARLEATLDLVEQRMQHAHERGMALESRSADRQDAAVGRRADQQAEARRNSREDQIRREQAGPDAPPAPVTPPAPVDLTHAT